MTLKSLGDDVAQLQKEFEHGVYDDAVRQLPRWQARQMVPSSQLRAGAYKQVLREDEEDALELASTLSREIHIGLLLTMLLCLTHLQSPVALCRLVWEMAIALRKGDESWGLSCLRSATLRMAYVSRLPCRVLSVSIGLYAFQHVFMYNELCSCTS